MINAISSSLVTISALVLAATPATTMLMVWMTVPFLVGFCIYLLPKFFPKSDRILALGVVLVSLACGLFLLISPTTLTLQLLDQFGVNLIIDSLSGHFILTNALVTAAVIGYCWNKQKTAFFYTQTVILHGSVNAVFICADFISLYVALEVISVAAFLLIAYPRTNRSTWVGLRYLFVSNTAMLFYLIGAVLVYQTTHSFAFEGLAQAPADAIALIFLGLLTKGGIFISGLWLPLTHSESDTPVSALLSGVVIKTGVFPLIRCTLLMEEVQPLLTIFGIGTAVFGVMAAISAQDTKRMLAASTMSQLGFLLVAPAAAGLYALTHGLAKAALFLTTGVLPSRKFAELRRTPLPVSLWAVLAIASLSIAGFPLLAGFAAKTLTLKQLPFWQSLTLTLVSVGTAIALSKFLFIPLTRASKIAPSHQNALKHPSLNHPDQSANSTGHRHIDISFWIAVGLLIGGLIAANIPYFNLYSPSSLLKSIITIAIGGLLYWPMRLFAKLISAVR
ncbi:MAG: cation:proton antiporter, partial [Merismopedia sp. SIO2A8]|nr:cation:proton antiporter [Merismopedia sp. SIO2A8]